MREHRIRAYHHLIISAASSRAIFKYKNKVLDIRRLNYSAHIIARDLGLGAFWLHSEVAKRCSGLHSSLTKVRHEAKLLKLLKKGYRALDVR
jgi:hypothetical protein